MEARKTGGGQFGFNWQVQNWVVGLEADVEASSANASSRTNVQVAPLRRIPPSKT
jgi:hypothetical protein